MAKAAEPKLSFNFIENCRNGDHAWLLGRLSIPEVRSSIAQNINATDYSAKAIKRHEAHSGVIHAVLEGLLNHMRSQDEVKVTNSIRTLALLIPIEGINLNILDLSGHTPISILCSDKVKPLWEERGSTIANVLRMIIAGGGNPNIADKEGDTPLALAAKNGYPEVINVLMGGDNKPDINALNNGKTPISHAIKSCNLETTKLLLDLGARVDVPDSDGMLPFFQAIALREHGNAAVDLLLSRFPDVAFQSTGLSGNAFAYAVSMSNLTAMEKVISARQKADPHALRSVMTETNRDGANALAASFWQDNLEVVRKVIDIIKRIEVAVSRDEDSEAKYDGPALEAPSLMSEVLAQQDSSGWTALHRACSGTIPNSSQIIKILAPFSPPLHILNNLDFTPIQLACYYNNTQALQQFVENWPEELTLFAGKEGRLQSPLMVAATHGKREAAKFILKYHPKEIDKPDAKNDSALHYAARSYSTTEDMIELLISKAPAEANRIGDMGLTPIENAAIFCDKTGKHANILVKLLEPVVKLKLQHQGSYCNSDRDNLYMEGSHVTKGASSSRYIRQNMGCY